MSARSLTGRWEAISGSADRRVEMREEKGTEARQSWTDMVLLWAAGVGSCWDTLGDSTEHASELSQPRGKKLGCLSFYILFTNKGVVLLGVSTPTSSPHTGPQGKPSGGILQVLAGGSCRYAGMRSDEEIWEGLLLWLNPQNVFTSVNPSE